MLLLNKCPKESERGASLLMVMLVIFLFAGIMAPMALHMNKIGRSRNLLNQIQMMALVEARVRAHLVGSADSCAMSAQFARFRDFTAGAPVISFNLGNVDTCLLDKDEARSFRAVFSSATIRVSETMREKATLSRSIELRMSFLSKEKSSEGVVSRPSAMVKNLRLRTLNLANFGIFFLSGSKPLFQTTGNALSYIKGFTYYSGTGGLGIYDITDLKAPKVAFGKTFFTRTKQLQSSKSQVIDVDVISQVFPAGLETATLDSPLLPGFLPNASARWNFRMDQYPLQKSAFGVPVPETSKGNGGSAASCFTSDPNLLFSSTRANYTAIPNLYMDSLSKTCDYNSTQIPLFFHSRPTTDLTVNMSAGDNVLCGIIAADTLTIKLKDVGNYGFFGNIFAKKIVISGPTGGADPASIYFYNPEDNLVPVVPLPPGQNQRGLLEEFKTLASSLAWNFQIPIASGSPFVPRTPQSMLKPCSPGGVLSYQSEYKPLHDLAGFDDVAKNSGDKALVVLEEVL